MTKNLRAPRAAFPFAHLFSASAPAAEEDDPSKQRADESDEDYAKRMEEEERKQREGESDEEYAARIKALDEQDDEDTEQARQAGRTEERARCAAIFASPAAGIRPDMAAHFAFNTNMTTAEAVTALQAAAGGSSRPAGLAARMAHQAPTSVGVQGGASQKTGAASLADQILQAGAIRRGENK